MFTSPIRQNPTLDLTLSLSRWKSMVRSGIVPFTPRLSRPQSRSEWFGEEIRVNTEIVWEIMQAKCKCNIKERSRNNCCRGKDINVTYSKRTFVSFAIQLAKRIRRVSSSLACLALRYFLTSSHKWHGFGEKFVDAKMCFFHCKFCLKYLSF